ncbi:glycosyltransferase family 4 protein [Sporolactobacillus laevolacticus]|uniref:glycosyltransferase family 4 protein n=1 Tax=Sporolactobacillus laevolacticus TaxID=33018 RepID=UPI0025B4E9F5|nr:glycosyltransferase family 4 protein [Sporolactobacillus laevolacticus]MDN3955224.1 glycosyltransferase family 4 protein [Sporolactobacillus laevolacticus]
MNIAMIATEKLPVPAIRGGAIQIYLQSTAEIIVQKHQVTVFSIRDPHLQDDETAQGVHYIRLDEEHYLSALTEELKKTHYDVIHVCNRPAWVEPLKQVTPDSKFILSVHNEMFAEGKITKEDGETCINDVSGIVTVSDFIGNTITQRFPGAKDKTRTVYSGVDLDAYHPVWTDQGNIIRKRMRERAGLEGKKIALFVGRLSKVKGPHILLQAIPEIIEKHPDVMLVFVGSKWFDDDKVNNYVRHLYTLGAMHLNHVTFIKFIKPQDIPNFYSMSDIFVCCSQWQEPLARVHYEAMAAGLPIITTNRGGNAEVIEEGQNGIVIDRFDDPHEYARIINSLFDDEEKRKQMGGSGRSIAEQKYGWQRVADQLLDAYQTV